ncbi:MAG: lysylphosphatidylglycerol synthase transmembrane domain-containing protein [Kiritimatiellaeota bacterium]|nr:lysylphosphatidylglycerol synthase transmembrane domain-containing protein [Kiritimatiellota bacterium]
MKSVVAKWTGRLVRVAIFAALVVWLGRRLDWSLLREGVYGAVTHPLGIIGGVLLSLLAYFTAALRWRSLLAAQGVALSTGRVMSIFFIGQFFNSFMLGTCGGDMARIYYVLRGTTVRRTEAVTSVLIDRGIGVYTQIFMGCGLILASWPLFHAHPALQQAALLMMALGLGASVLLAVLLWKNIFERFAFIRRLERATPLGTRFRRAYEELFRYRARPRAIAAALFYSALNLLFQVAVTLCLGHSLGMNAPWSAYLTFVPVISVLTAIPLTPGSIGVREWLFILLFGAVGVEAHQAVLLSLLFFATGVLWNLFGGVVFLGYNAGAGFTLREELARIRHGAGDHDGTPPTPS